VWNQNGQNTWANGSHVITSSLTDKTTYKYGIQDMTLSPTYSSYLCSRRQSEYNFKDAVSYNCPWTISNQNYDIYFNGRDNAYEKYNQNYQFKGNGINSLSSNQWNYSDGSDGDSIWNRALGSAKSYSIFSQKNQSNNVTTATPFAGDESYLLGLQSVNSMVGKDSNTYRPQLQLSGKQKGEVFDREDSNVISENGLDAANRYNGSTITRTGQPNSLYSFGRPFKLKISR
jgi:hypothetical protein